MQFKIVKDTGDLIVARMVLEKESAAPKILVLAPDADEVEIEASRSKQREKNRGKQLLIANYRVTEDLFPNLSETKDIEIRDAASGVLLFRRFDPEQHLKSRLFLHSLQVMPEQGLESALSRHFAMAYHAVERFSLEVLTDLISNESAPSVCMMGRPALKHCLEPLKAGGFKTATLLRDPYEEFAERLWFVRLIVENKGTGQFLDRLTDLRPLLKRARNVETGNDESPVEMLKSLNKKQRQALANPLTRSLACDLEETPTQHHVSIALNNLSHMDLVGLAERFEDFKPSFYELLNLEIDLLEGYQPTANAWVTKAAAELAQFEEIDSLLALDVELYAHAKEAVELALDLE